ncbi:MAG: di-trans,poly-cis-decaprenylcistransferase [Candidatus Moranbacteria bacterium CG_4_8_14_3_um_filter_41_13]|nr:MAG: di-trans,poly-cis-decaprenylcistransferase [Candidatus Moranbacteria bacterium CG_4_8_14_3_um_filter_41_13]PJB99942.1 MAG: di-trans,poly-cis-decaprenylcistransferase [Candidatus Moranbacteria bacterium CG_4_9_14_0_8_um_filter_41_43]
MQVQKTEKENDGLPYHVVIIPDGNRRWATDRQLEPWEGHEEGARNTEKLIREAKRLGIKEISFWGSSLENLVKRPVLESRALLRIYETYFKELLESKDIHDDEVHIRFIGRWEEQFPASLKKIMHECLEATKHYNKRFLNFFLAYSGDDDMRQAIQKIVNTQPGTTITNQVIKDNLMTKETSSVDLLIRTGGEPHLSAGFMMWDIANVQFFFSEKYYPDFDELCLQEAISDYVSRGRRFGK